MASDIARLLNSSKSDTDKLNSLFQEYLLCAVSSLEEFETVVNESACVNQAQLIGKEDGSSFVPVGEWQQHLSL